MDTENYRVFGGSWQTFKVSVIFTNLSVAIGCSAGTDINYLLIVWARNQPLSLIIQYLSLFDGFGVA